MIELRCPSCGLANGVLDDQDPGTTRCAGCADSLQAGRPVRYTVHGHERVWGHQVQSDLALRASGGTLTRDTLISEEGGPWFRAGERLDLFPVQRSPSGRSHAPLPVRPAAPVRRRPTERTRIAPPGAVEAMAVLNAVAAVLLVILAVFAFVVAASFGAGGGAVLFSAVIGLLAWVNVVIAKGLRRGSQGARNAQLGLAGVSAVILFFVGPDMGGVALLVGVACVALPFLLLCNAKARAWFEQPEGSSRDVR